MIITSHAPAAYVRPRPAAATQPEETPKKTQTNFGGNRTWESTCYALESDQEVLEILERHKNGHIRPMGSKHSWSDVAVTDDVTLDMSRMNRVTITGDTVKVQAGCRLQDLLDFVHENSDRTLPTLGAIKRQTISGAISTGTHGSGKQSISHFVKSLKVAAYDEHGKPKIYHYTSGEELKAARCGLGCTGVILEVELQTVPRYQVQETVKHHDTLDSVLAAYPTHPLTQFTMTPYRWDFTAWERKPVEHQELGLKDRIKAGLFRAYNTAGVDVAFHLLLKGSLMLGDSAVKNLMKLSPNLVVRNIERTDDAEKVLTLGHHYFRHEEMEMFVPESKLQESVQMLREVTEVFAGETAALTPETEQKLKAKGLYDELMANHGTYTQHYPFFFRRVMPEDTLIGMAGGQTEPSYSISVFTYNAPEDRGNYGKFCEFLSKAIDPRLHWGKRFPQSSADVARKYPELGKFQELCRRTDPNGVFRNDYTHRVLGLG